jgi:hypothetical protein
LRPRADGPPRGSPNGAVGAACSGDLDVVRVVARRFCRGASADAARPRSRGERAPVRTTPSEPTPRSGHMRATACAHLGAVVIGICDTRRADARMPVSGAEGWERRNEAGRCRRDGAAPVLPRSVRRHAPFAAGARGEGEGYTPTRPPRPRDPSHRRRAERATTAASRIVGLASRPGPRRHRRFRAGRRRQEQELAAPEAHEEGGAPPPADVRARGRARKEASQRARMAARRTRSTPVRLRGDKVGSRTLGGPRSPVPASRKWRTRLRTGGEREDDC